VMGPRRIVIRRGPGGADLGHGAGPTRDELRELREEVRDLRVRIERLQNRD